TLHEPEFRSERDVVENERRLRVDDDVEGLAGEALHELSYRAHPYRWPTIGYLEDFPGYRLSDVRAFYRGWYAPNTATTVAVGDIDEEATLELSRAHYGALSAAPLPARSWPAERAQRKERWRVLHEPTASAKAHIGYRGPALADPDYPAVMVLSELLFGGR